MISKYIRICAALILVCALAACGGGGGGSSSGGGGGGGNGGGGGGGDTLTRVVMNVDWPERNRNVAALSSAQSIKVVLTGANQDNSDFTWIANRDADTTAHTARMVSPNLTRAGHWPAILTLYSLPNGGGAVVGNAGANVDLKSDGTGLDTLVVTGVVATVTVVPNQSVPVNQVVDLAFEARDSSNNLIAITPGSAVWQVVTGQTNLVAITSGADKGKFKGAANGQATVKATIDGETSAAVDVAVGPQFGTLNVTVKDPFGALLPNTTINLVQNGTSKQQVTLATGSQAIQTALLGQVDVRATKPGYLPGQTTISMNRVVPASASIVLTAIAKPSASTGGTAIVSNNASSLTFETNVSVLDGDGNPISNLPNSAFTINPATITSAEGVALPITAVNLVSAAYTSKPSLGPVSAFIALDASGSVSSTDPQAVRIQAAKTFFQALGGGDEAMLGYFPAASNTAELKSFTDIGFVTDGSLYFPKLDEIAGLGNLLSTPLYRATMQAADIVAASGKNTNKAVVLFTDGQPSGDTATLNLAVAEAKAKGIRVYAAGLGSGTNLRLLADLAEQTGGSVMFAEDAGQLVTFYKTLGNLLQGAGSFYKTRWTAVRTSGTFKTGDTLFGLMQINVNGTVIKAPFLVRIR